MTRATPKRRRAPAMAAPQADGGGRRRGARRVVLVLVLVAAAGATAVAVRQGVGVPGSPDAPSATGATPSAAPPAVFRLEALEVRGLRLLTAPQILAASGVEVGAALFDVDLDSVATRIDRLVWVRAARVERKPPDRLVVHLEERRRALWVEWRGRLHGLDENGVLLPAARLPAEGIGDLDLPVLRRQTVSLPDSLELGEAVPDSSVQQLVAWWSTARHVAPELAAEISEIEAVDDATLALRLIADDLEVRLPYGRVAERLSALRQVLAKVYGECPNPAYVDMRFAGQAVVGTRAAAPSPAGAAGASTTVAGQERQGHG